MKKAAVHLIAVLSILFPALASAQNAGDFSGGVAIGTSYAGVDAAPTNGLIVQGNVGIGTSTASSSLNIYGGNVNGIAQTGASIGNSPTISAVGSDTNIALTLQGKGTGSAAIHGSSTNDSAAAGYVGEFVRSLCPYSTGSSTVTISIASPAVITYSGNGLGGNPVASNSGGICPVTFSTTGSLPTGITAGTVYWTIGSTIAANTFEIASSITNAIAGTAINTSGSQSGTQTGTLSFPLTSTTAANIAAVSLSPGTWMVCGSAGYSPVSATIQWTDEGINNVSATIPGPAYRTTSVVPSGTGVQLVNTVPCIYAALSSTTTYYLVDDTSFSAGTMDAGPSYIYATRIR